MERKRIGILLDTALYFLIVLLLWFIFQKLGLVEGDIIVNAAATTIGWCIARFVIDFVRKVRNKHS